MSICQIKREEKRNEATRVASISHLTLQKYINGNEIWKNSHDNIYPKETSGKDKSGERIASANNKTEVQVKRNDNRNVIMQTPSAAVFIMRINERK